MNLELHPHPTVPGLFLTRDGRVFREMPSYVDENGYTCIHVPGSNQYPQIIRRHTLMAETFIGPQPVGQEVRHLDGNPANDDPGNLAWGTRLENAADMVRHGRSRRGQKNRWAKLTEAQAREIKRRRAAGESGRSLAREFGISEQQVSGIHHGRDWSWLNSKE